MIPPLLTTHASGTSPTSTTYCLSWLGVRKKSQYFSHSTAILLHSQGSHWKTALQINWFSPSLAEIVKNSYNFPLRRLFHENDLVLLFMFYSWNTGFTLQGFRSITKLSRRRYIVCGIFKARYILCCISAWKKTLKITRVHFLRSEPPSVVVLTSVLICLDEQ